MKPHPDCPEDRYIPVTESGCWLWLGSVEGSGYPKFDRGNVTIRAHVYFYEREHGPLPAGKIVCHTCDVPICVNPAHLVAGTPKTNMADMVRKGRNTLGFVVKLTPAQRTEIGQSSESTRNLAKRFSLCTRYVRQLKASQRTHFIPSAVTTVLPRDAGFGRTPMSDARFYAGPDQHADQIDADVHG